MEIILAVVCVLCLCLGFACISYRAELKSLYRQLEEVAAGSHIELTLNSRCKPLLALCRMLNHVLQARDRDYLQYDQAEKRLKQDITSLAHDIRTPLTGAFGYVQLAQECTDTEKRQHYLDAVERRLRELEDMLEELFLYTKVTGEDFRLSVESLQALPLLGECLLGLYARFQEAGTAPEVRFDTESFRVMADQEALRRVFLNLITNALVHGAGRLSIVQTGNRISFENPVSEESLPNPERLFDRFYKSDPSRRKGSSGLGLFIVRELMRKMGGDAEASLEGGALRITLCFPEDSRGNRPV